jgi:hypothetical protein
MVRLSTQALPHHLDEPFRFEVLTSFPERPTVIERSPNLRDWSPISTNQPATNRFTFTESLPATNSHRFYRVLVPPE